MRNIMCVLVIGESVYDYCSGNKLLGVWKGVLGRVVGVCCVCNDGNVDGCGCLRFLGYLENGGLCVLFCCESWIRYSWREWNCWFFVFRYIGLGSIVEISIRDEWVF